MSHDQYGPYGGRRPGPPPPMPMPAYAVPPQKQRGKGCLYAFIGGVATLFLMVSCAAIVATGGSTSDPAATSGDEPAASAPAKGTAGGDQGTEKKPKKAVTNGIGREYRDGKFAFTVTKVKKGVKKVGNEYFGDKAQGQFVIIYVTVKNIGDKARTFTHHNQTLIDTKEREFEADPEASLWTTQDSKSFLQQINPGNSVKGKLIYDVPPGTRLKAIELHDSMFSGGVTVPLGNR
ncbi:DUF4352 domain-containing protein [Spirillospora sp. NPDC048819]|uniref:DUF4352 domain-containing protein n=1 Tax=Spirillospora sp. NPDC048819 TaxID=3155268 RepID=UPI0033FA3E67